MILFQRPHLHYEKRLRKQGYHAVVGVDEVGRGAWAGPLVACAVIMPLRPRINGVRDSKQLTERNRELFAQKIRQKAICCAVSAVSHQEIDRIGIVAANELAIVRAIELLPVKADYVLVDTLRITRLEIANTGVIHGDAAVYSIAAASIVAKVARDQMMREYHQQYSAYGFDQNKGYGTEHHQHALSVYGPCHIHRQSFHPMNTMV